MKKLLVFIILIAITAACAAPNSAPPPESDNRNASYDAKAVIPIDDNIYAIRGKVVADTESLTRQISPAQGDVFGYNGYTSGHYTGPVIDGKSFIRVLVESIFPSTESARAGEIVILKFTDTKAQALLPGDVIQTRCRREYEAIAPVRQYADFDANVSATWEFDFCRLYHPSIGVEKP